MFFCLANDCSEEEPILEKFVFKFGNPENAEKFKKAFNAAKEYNKVAKAGGEPIVAEVLKEEDDEEKKDVKKEEKKD